MIRIFGRVIQKMMYSAVVILLIFGCRSTEKDSTDSGIAEADSSQNKPLIFTLDKIADSLYAPVALENAHDGSGRLFVGEQAGRIMIIKDGKVLQRPFLDIRRLLVPMRNEYMDVGILGFAFHPDYKSNGRFFVHYSARSVKGYDHTSVLAEFHVSKTDPDVAGTENETLLEVEQPEPNHNGGNIVFDDKGYLYIGFGDGGGQGDQHGKVGNGQDMDQLLGKIIRIDVDHEKPYRIPDDNPFANGQGRKEIWCYGMRMPWRISFDTKTQELFCGDVGQNLYEEVNIIEKGKNYGWRAMEGSHVYDSGIYNAKENYVLPIAEYAHPEGLSITGGYVYRGKLHPGMEGKYIFGDWAFKLFYMEKKDSGWVKRDCEVAGLPEVKFRVNSFGVDEEGEIYVVTQNEIGAISPTGVIYKMGVEN